MAAPQRGSAKRQDRSTDQVALSTVVVTYRSRETMPQLWPSLRAELEALGPCELHLVDNASADGTLGVLREIETQAAAIPDLTVSVTANDENVGFGRACNQALAAARGECILLLNPDTILEPGAIAAAIAFLEAHPDVGILGPRVLLTDGRLDAPCRRAFKTPEMYLYRFTGLSRLFPHHRRFGSYFLSYLPEDQTADVDTVIGAFLLTRRTVLEQIGLFDERFFMFCEDEDLCFRAKQAGWRVVYYPAAVVRHRKGASTRTRRARMVWELHHSIYLFHRKNLARNYPWWINALVYAGLAGGTAALMATAALRGLAERPPHRA